jgi:hypothetical protein
MRSSVTIALQLLTVKKYSSVCSCASIITDLHILTTSRHFKNYLQGLTISNCSRRHLNNSIGLSV